MSFPLWRFSRREAGKRCQPPHRRILALEVFEARRLLAGPTVDHVDPMANSYAAPLGTDVSATFDQQIDPGSVSDATFAVHSMQSGRLLQPANTLAVSGRTITLDPAAEFKPGELVQATTTTGIENTRGEGAAAPFVWQFRAKAAGGSGVFEDSGQTLGNTMSWAMALGDFDGDGDLDAFVGNLGDPNTVWLNDGQGNFIDSGQNLGRSESVAVALGDLDGDGDLDAFVGNGGFNDSPNKVWLNGGDGHFTDSGQSLGNSASYGVALGDLDGDGDLDAFIANHGDLSTSQPNQVWINDGQGTFTNSGQSLGNSPSADVALGDLDGDGDLDAFVANDTGRRPNKVWLNDGQGRFHDTGQSLGRFLSMDVDLGDLDGDGDLDAFVANSDDPNTVWINNGQGTFGDSGQRLGGEVSSFAVALGDLDGDGRLDAFVGNWSGGADQVWLGDGQGRFHDSGQLLSDADTESVALGDVDADGDLDACVANYHPWDPNLVWLNQNPEADLAISKTDGQVVATPGGPLDYTITVTNHGPDDVTGAMVSDVFPAQLHDVTWTAVASPGSSCTPGGSGNIDDTVNLLVGGTVTYTATGTLAWEATGTPTNLAAVTVPAGCVDPVSENNTASDTDTILNPHAAGGSGVFEDSGQTLGITLSWAMALGDFDGDGDLDAFVGNLGPPNTVWLNDGQGNFIDSGQNLGRSLSAAVAIGDLDGDGDLDAFVGNGGFNDSPNKVWLNGGDGHFTDSGQSLGNSASQGVALGDLDGDGDLDALVANHGGWDAGQPNKVWINDGQGNFTNSGQSLGSSPSADVALGDLDGDGDLDAFVTNRTGRRPNKVWLNDGQGRFHDTGRSLGRSLSMDVALADLDGDGDLDAFVANSNDPNTVWINNGQGTFGDSGQRLGGDVSSYAVALGDLDGDGHLDAFVGNWSGSADEVWLGDGQGRFHDSGQLLSEVDTEAVALGDVDADGDLDACVASFEPWDPNLVWLNQNQDVPEVVGRHVFYNNSAFDDNNPVADAQDDNAIAPDKQALLPGETADFANYTSYSRGINGVMVDIAAAAGTPTAADFEFRVGNDDDPSGWLAAPAPQGVTVRQAAGTDGSDRVTIIWADNAIQKQWLQVTVLATANTALPEPQVFYFGNAIGECGNSTTEAKVNAADMLGARDNQRSFLDPAPIDFPFDFDRDARVGAADMLIARNSQTHFLNALKLITVPGPKVANLDPEEAEQETAHDAVLRKAAGSSGRQDVPLAKLDWLYELEPITARRQDSAQHGPSSEALDKLPAVD